MENEVSREEYLSSVFATMVMQLTNMAAMFMGKVPNPENNQMVVDLDAAQIFIDQLEMLEAKTKGNLDAEEQNILKQGLTMVRMAFVEAVDSGQIVRFTGNDFAQPLARGTFAASVAWSGDVVQLLADNPKLKWAIPTDGGMIWTDNMFIPAGGSVPTASTFMNFVYEPAVAAKLAAAIAYVSPVKGAKEEMAKTDPETANNTLIFPDDETLSRVNQYDSEALNNDEHIQKWQAVLGQ